MASISASLKRPKSKKSPIWITLCDGREVNIKFYTNISIETKHWSKSGKGVLSGNPNAVDINGLVDTMKERILGIYLDAKAKGIKADKAYIEKEMTPVPPKPDTDFWDIWEKFTESKRIVYKERSISKYKTLKDHLASFESKTKHPLVLDDLKEETLESIQSFFYETQGLNTQTAAKYLGLFKTFLNWAVSRGHTENIRFKYFKPIRQPSSIHSVITDEELNDLKKLNLTDKPHLDNVRHLFILSILTGLRYSDYKRIHKSHIVEDGDDLNLRMRQQKTDTIVEIPLVGAAVSIIEKIFNKEVHSISNQKMNNYLKDLCEEAGFDSPVEQFRYVGRKKEQFTLPKFKTITTHTGRRTFATNLLQKGIPAEVVMEYTGHKDYKSFAKYVNIPKMTQKAMVRDAISF